MVSPALAFWQAYEPAVKSDLSCCARRFGNALVFIDPIPLAKSALAELTADAAPTAIIVTNGNHARAAAEFRERFSIPILAHAEADLGIVVDQTIADGDLALGKLTVIEIAGAAPGEIALHADGVLHVGDALIHLEATGFTLLPDKYCADPRELRRSLGKLLRFEFELLTFAHGLPLISKARRRLETLLA
jgi:glyoxylase-like metal-dependent hydrolase (beta-lactamase superfamily II)